MTKIDTTMIALVLFLGIAVIGCKRDGTKPSDFPKVFPCTVTVTDGNAPLADANISLISDKPMSNITITGRTDASGVAKIRTSQAAYFADGAPEGNYKVLVSKPQTIEHTKSESERAAMDPDAQAAYEDERQKKINAMPKIVPATLNKQDTTPLTLSVSGSGGELTVNLSEYKK